MGCNCSSSGAVSVERFAVVEDVTLANTPQSIPAEAKFNTVADATIYQASRGPTYHIVAIVDN